MFLTILNFILLILIVIGVYKYYRLREFIIRFSKSINDLNDGNINCKSVPKILNPLHASFSQRISLMQANLNKDKLTGLSNCFEFKNKLKELLPDSKGFVILIDICQFRYINDHFGFLIGDKLLTVFSNRLLNLSISAKEIARVTDDGFLLYYENSLNYQQLLQLKTELQVSIIVDDIPISLRLQFGCLKLTREYDRFSQIHRQLELALRKAKGNKNLIGFYSKNDARIRLRQLSIINSLAKALEYDEFFLVFQPKQNVATGECLQVEALMRWQHPELGMVSPAEFIPLAEYTGMIELVSRWTLTKVLEQQVKWRAMGLHIQVAVNLSTQDLTSSTLCQEIDAQLKEFKLPADALEIEITESTLMSNVANGVNTLIMLRKLGVKLAIDDFGTGHSSLAYLKNLPVDEVKIDKAFITDLLTDLHAAHIMETSIVLAKKLGIEVTVEGVETKDVRDLLVFMGVDKIQGNFFSKPLTTNELEDFLPVNKKQNKDQTAFE